MRDKFLIFGDINPSTKNTVAYAADIIELGNATSPTAYPAFAPGMAAVFQPLQDFAAADGFAPMLFHCDTSDGTYEVCAQGGTVTAPKKGQQIVLTLPASCKRYVKAGVNPTSTGTLTSTSSKVTACIEVCPAVEN